MNNPADYRFGSLLNGEWVPAPVISPYDACREGRTLVSVVVDRAAIESSTAEQTLRDAKLLPLPTDPYLLRQACGWMQLCVSGYDDDPRELYAIPEVRTFLAELRRAWRYGAFFLSTDPGCASLRILLLCSLRSLQIVNCAERPGVQRIQTKPAELERLFMEDVENTLTLCKHAGFSPEEGKEHCLQAWHSVLGARSEGNP